ncbi:GGDEF domain-containing protein [Hippea sp. KM1]|uniref:GGDEF domain-containing protein n=1 Tax=Hippea sp. KM1 TaxID=944481 RepID=UPI0004B1D630|nr:GGDEF domain-containing protein [Hippea sp. KM1]
MDFKNIFCPVNASSIVREALYRAAQKNVLLTPFNYYKIFIKTALDMGASEKEIRRCIYGYDSVSIDQKKLEKLKSAVLDITKKIEDAIKKAENSVEEGNEAYKEALESLDSHKNNTPPEIIEDLKNTLHTNIKLLNELEEAIKKLKKQEEILKTTKELSNIDQLTGLYTRRYMEKVLNNAIYEFYRYSRIFSVIMVDINGFKKINDTYSHIMGDVILQAIARSILDDVRKSDTAVRYGGDEFIIILPDTKAEQAKNIAKRMIEKIEALTFDKDGITDLSCSASVGITQIRKDDDINSILSRVDRALYKAKEKGRGEVVIL